MRTSTGVSDTHRALKRGFKQIESPCGLSRLPACICLAVGHVLVRATRRPCSWPPIKRDLHTLSFNIPPKSTRCLPWIDMTCHYCYLLGGARDISGRGEMLRGRAARYSITTILTNVSGVTSIPVATPCCVSCTAHHSHHRFNFHVARRRTLS